MKQAAKANADRLLAAASLAADRAGLKSRRVIGSGEDDAYCIVEAARKQRCNLSVIATGGRNALMRLMLGSVIPGLITSSPVPVLVGKLRRRSTVDAKADIVSLKSRRATWRKPQVKSAKAVTPARRRVMKAAAAGQ